MTAGPQPPVGVIAHYTLLERLEPAGPGDLFRARDTRLGRTVAVRLLPAEFPLPADWLPAARAAVAQSHPNLVAVFDAGEHEGRAYLVFELQTGTSLRATAAGRPLHPRRAVEIAIQLADAVAHLHAAGYLHQWLSPDAVVVSAKGRTKVPLLGLAAQSGFQPGHDDGRLVDYESPEEARGERPDERSDVYSIAAVLYETLTTRRPLHRGASAPSASNGEVPKDLDAVVLRALAPRAEARYPTAAGLAAALRESLPAIDAHASGTPQTASGVPRETGRVAPQVVALAVLVVLALAAWWFLR